MLIKCKKKTVVLTLKRTENWKNIFKKIRAKLKESAFHISTKHGYYDVTTKRL